VAEDTFGTMIWAARNIDREIDRQLLIDVVDKVRMFHVEACVQDADTNASSCHANVPGLDGAHSRVTPLKIKQKV
jgi:hypothetical protein